MKNKTTQTISALILSAAFASNSGLAEETNTVKVDQDNSGGYLKVGLGIKYQSGLYRNIEDKPEFAVFLSGRYQFENGLFAEINQGAHDINQGFSLGYNFYNTENWSLDVSYFEGRREIYLEASEHPIEIDGQIETHTSAGIHWYSTQMLAFRASGMVGDTQLQFVASPSTIEDNKFSKSIYASAWASQSWQLWNMDIHAALGLQYTPKESDDYTFEYEILDANDNPQTLSRRYVSASGGISVTAQLGFSYPVAKDWVFEGYFRHTEVSDHISNNDLLERAAEEYDLNTSFTEAGLMINYVF